MNFSLHPLLAKTIATTDCQITGYGGDLCARLYRPAEQKSVLPVVLYLHGGGFVAGSLEDSDPTVRQLVAAGDIAVLTLSYSLAPAHPFPAAPEDAYAGLCWLHDHARSLQLDPHRMAIAGDDAGGNLATTVCLITHDRNGPALSAQALIGPMLDPSMTLLGDPTQLRSDLAPQTCAMRYAQYLPRPRERLHPYASPLTSLRLQGLPPAYLATAKCDVLHLEAEKYAQALIAAGVPVRITRFDVTHNALPHHPALIAEVADFLHQRLQASPSPGEANSSRQARPTLPLH